MLDDKYVDIVIVTAGRCVDTIATVESLKRNNKSTRIILVNNDSKNTGYLSNKLIDYVINNPINYGQAYGINQGLQYVRTKYFITMHADVVIEEPNWIQKAVNFMENNDNVGLISIAGWKYPHHVLVCSLKNEVKKYPEAIKYFEIEGNFVKVQQTDSLVNICRNVGVDVDKRFREVGTAYFTQYLHLGYDLYTMKVINGEHLKGTTALRNSKKFIKNRRYQSIIFNKILSEYKLWQHKESK